MLNLAQRNIENGKKGFTNVSDCLETRDDSDIIMVVNSRKDLRHPANGGITTRSSQYQGSEINYEHTEVVGTELRLKFINLTSLQISNT